MRVRSIQVLSAALALVAIVACGGRKPMPALTYYEFKPVDPHAWRLTDTLRFRPDTATLAPTAELSLSLPSYFTKPRNPFAPLISKNKNPPNSSSITL